MTKTKGLLFGLVISALFLSVVFGFATVTNRAYAAGGPYPVLNDTEIQKINTEEDSDNSGEVNGYDSVTHTFDISSGEVNPANPLSSIHAQGNAADFVVTDSSGVILPFTAEIYNPFDEVLISNPEFEDNPEFMEVYHKSKTEVRTLDGQLMGATVKYYPYSGRVEMTSPYALSVPVEIFYVVRVSNTDPETFSNTAAVPMGSLTEFGNSFSVDEVLYKADNSPACVRVTLWNNIIGPDYNDNESLDFGDVKSADYFKGLLNYPIVIDGTEYTVDDITVEFGGDYDTRAHELVFFSPYAHFSVTYGIAGYLGNLPQNTLYFDVGENSSPSLSLVAYNESSQLWELQASSQAVPYVFDDMSIDDGGEIELFVASNNMSISLFSRLLANFDVEINIDSQNNTQYVETATIGGNFYFIYSLTLTPRGSAAIGTLGEGLSFQGSPAVYVEVGYYTDDEPQIIMRENKTEFEFNRGVSLEAVRAEIESWIYQVEDMGVTSEYWLVKNENPAEISINDYNSGVSNTYGGTITWTGGTSNNICELSVSVVVLNRAPSVSFGDVSAGGGGVESGNTLNVGTIITGVLAVSDLDGDAVQIYVDIDVGSSDAILDIEGSNFTLVPEQFFVGTIVITAYAVDEFGLEGETVTFVVKFADIEAPVIEFMESVVNGIITLDKSKTPLNLLSFVKSVSDNMADLEISDIVIDGAAIRTFDIDGDFGITYRLSDGSGNTSIRTITVTVLNTIPTIEAINESALSYLGEHKITLQGFDANEDELEYDLVSSTWYVDGSGQEYVQPFKKFSIDGNILTVEISLSGVNGTFPAVVIFNYRVYERMYGGTVLDPQAQIKLTFVDDIAPVITMQDLSLKFDAGEAPSDFDPTAYFEAEDEIDGTIKVTLSNITGGVNFEKAGTYTLTCTVLDKSGNSTEKSVTITVEGGSGSGENPPDPSDNEDDGGIIPYIIIGSIVGAGVTAGIVMLIISIIRKSRMKI